MATDKVWKSLAICKIPSQSWTWIHRSYCSLLKIGPPVMFQQRANARAVAIIIRDWRAHSGNTWDFGIWKLGRRFLVVFFPPSGKCFSLFRTLPPIFTLLRKMLMMSKWYYRQNLIILSKLLFLLFFWSVVCVCVCTGSYSHVFRCAHMCMEETEWATFRAFLGHSSPLDFKTGLPPRLNLGSEY